LSPWPPEVWLSLEDATRSGLLPEDLNNR
jgi:hypothetical protein